MDSVVLLYAGRSPGYKLAVVPWARSEVWGEVGIGSALECHGELGRGNGDYHQIPRYRKWGCRSNSCHMVGGGDDMR